MFERLSARGAALGRDAARRRLAALAEILEEETPAGIRVEESEGAVVLSGRGLARRHALEPALRWLFAGRRQ